MTARRLPHNEYRRLSRRMGESSLTKIFRKLEKRKQKNAKRRKHGKKPAAA